MFRNITGCVKVKRDEGAKRRLIQDLQSFLWRFEQGGYTRETMYDVLEGLEKALETDGEAVGGNTQEHVEQMIRDCRAYAFGGGDPKKVIGDLIKLREDLEQ